RSKEPSEVPTRRCKRKHLLASARMTFGKERADEIGVEGLDKVRAYTLGSQYSATHNCLPVPPSVSSLPEWSSFRMKLAISRRLPTSAALSLSSSTTSSTSVRSGETSVRSAVAVAAREIAQSLNKQLSVSRAACCHARPSRARSRGAVSAPVAASKVSRRSDSSCAWLAGSAATSACPHTLRSSASSLARYSFANR